MIRTLFFLVLIVFAAYFLLIATRRRINRNRKNEGLSAKQRVEMRTKEKDMLNNIGELMGELAELSRQINGQIDTRSKKLEILMDQADQRIRQIQNLQNNQTDKGQKHRLNNGYETSVLKPPPSSSMPNHTSDKNLTGKSLTTDPDAPTDSNHAQAIANGSIDDSQQTRQVLQLAEKGMSDLEIAKVLDRPVGEVQLILALTKKNRSNY